MTVREALLRVVEGVSWGGRMQGVHDANLRLFAAIAEGAGAEDPEAVAHRAMERFGHELMTPETTDRIVEWIEANAA